ncbi:MAG: S8 family serine peptidase, partial [Kiritimatiellaeota bacterium]|nr:S8 family serine peptidase [Kiritimatiellota bacterium]
EQDLGSNPRAPDTDDDGVNDAAEVAAGTDPTDAHAPYSPRILAPGGGSSDYLELPAQYRFVFDGDWTIEAWVRNDGDADGGVIVEWTVGAEVNYELGIDADLHPYVRYVHVAPGAGVPVYERRATAAAVTVADGGGWVHLAGVFDPAANTLAIVVNGVTEWTLDADAIRPDALAVGVVHTRLGRGFKGAVDDVRFWSTARSADTIAASMGAALTGSESGLVAWYMFDDGGVSAQDDLAASAADWLTGWYNAGRLVGTATMQVDQTAPVVQGPDDSDADGIADWWERVHFGDLTTADSTTDADGDNLTDLYEFYAGTDPNNKYTVNDGVLDGDRDSDGDGLTNIEEQVDWHSDPGAADTDDDGIPDSFELNGLLPVFFVDVDASATWNVGEPAWVERTNNTTYNAGEDTPITAAAAAPADGAVGLPLATDKRYVRPSSPLYSMSPVGAYGQKETAGSTAPGARSLNLVALPATGLGIPVDASEVGQTLAEWTVEAWFYSGDAAAQTGAIVKRQVGEHVGFELGVETGKPYIRYQTAKGTEWKVQARSTVPNNAWTHLAGVWDPGARTLSLIVNGGTVLTHEFEANAVDIAPADGSASISLGAGAWTDALIDEVRVWALARSAGQIDRQRREWVSSIAPGLIRDFRFDDGGLSIEDFAHAGWRNERYVIRAADYGVLDADADGNADWLDAQHAQRFYGADDADLDDMPDWFESLYGLDDPSGDADRDGLTNLYEYLCGTNPVDTTNGNADLIGDSDGDGLSNELEQKFGTDPRLADTDHDGWTDAEEVLGDNDPATILPRRPNEDAFAADPLNPLSPAHLQSLVFDGSGYVRVPDQAKYALPSWTIEAWVQPGVDPGSGTLLRRVVGTAAGTPVINYELGIDNDNGVLRPYVRFVTISGDEIKLGGTSAFFPNLDVAADVWTHLAASFDQASYTMTLYINGMPVAEHIFDDGVGAPSQPECPAVLDADAGVEAQPSVRLGEGYKGRLDEVRIWGAARDPGDIYRTYRTVNAGALGRAKRFDVDLPDAGGQALSAQEAAAKDHVPHELLVAFRSTVQAADRTRLLADLGATVVRRLPLPGLVLVRVPDNADLAAKIEEFRARLEVRYAEPNYIVQASRVPNDPMFDRLWGLNNTGQTGGSPDADIDAPEAWESSIGSDQVIVAVIDTGVDYTHPDLAANMWTNPGEIPGNGIDDDGNGYVDDVYGYDFANDDGDPMDDHFHGTHVAGTIGGVGNNGIGVAGVNWRVKIMAVKFLSASGGGTTAGAIAAIDYSVRMGAKISNNSWGGFGFSQALYDAIARAKAAGQLFVAAAGNYGMNNDDPFWGFYPASFDLENIVAVAASDQNDRLASFSHYGATSVDLAAPGVNIYSTLPNGQYGYLDGTSMASPHVAGAAALVWGERPDATWADVKSYLMASVDPKPGLQGLMVTGGRLNAAQALAIARSRRLIAYFRCDDGAFTTAAGDTLVKDLTETEDWLLDENGRHAGVLVAGVQLDDADVAPVNGDSDWDGMPDWYETAQGFDPVTADGLGDADGDGLNNYYEYLAGTNPFDSVSDGTTPDPSLDSDGDGVDNLHEQIAQTHPGDANADTDDDAKTDKEEAGTSPPTSAVNALSPYVRRVLELQAGSYLELPNQPRFDLIGSWTVSLWINLDPTDADGGILLRRAIDDNGDGNFDSVNYEIGLDGGLKPYVRFTSDTTTGNVEVKVLARQAIEPGTWTHVAGVYDAAAGTLAVIVDNGYPAVASTGGVTPAAGIVGRVDLRAGDGIVGKLDSLRIWQVARTGFDDNRLGFLGVSAGASATSASSTDGTVPSVTAADITADGIDPDHVQKVKMTRVGGEPGPQMPDGLNVAPATGETARQTGIRAAAVPAGLVAQYLFDDGGQYAQDFAVRLDDWKNDWQNAARPVGAAATSAAPDSPVAPISTDTDGDGMPDWWEYRNGTWVSYPDGDWDADGDGLSNLYEYWAGTDPNSDDTDFDGIPDASEDFDGDGLTNIEEQRYRTRPDLKDTDDDDFDDKVEIDNFSNPTHPMNQPNRTPGNLATAKSLDLASGGAEGIVLPHPERFGFRDGPWTVEAWVKPGQDKDGNIFIFTGSNGQGFRLSLQNGAPHGVIFGTDPETGTVKVLVQAGGDGKTPALPADRWTHMALAWDPDNLSLRLYRDGVLVMAQRTLVRPNVSGYGAAFIAQGFDDQGADNGGLADDVRVWDFSRNEAEIEYWHNRLIPTMEEVDMAPGGGFSYFFFGFEYQFFYRMGYEYRDALRAYYRFDDGGKTIEDFAHFLDPEYVLEGGARTTDDAARIIGIDDADTDGVPDWWARLYNLNEYAQGEYGPYYVWNQAGDNVDGIYYYHAFTAFMSIGDSASFSVNNEPWVTTKSDMLGEDTKYAWFVKYLNLNHVPQEALFEFHPRGATVGRFYVNGTLFAVPAGLDVTVDIASALRVGRNQLAFEIERSVSWVYREQLIKPSDGTVLDYDHDSYWGKIDVALTADGKVILPRGDDTRYDPRTVWHGIGISEWAFDNGRADFRDMIGRGLDFGPQPNPDYGIALDPDQDGLENVAEYMVLTNPQDSDTDNDGIPDGQEDYDGDSLSNAQEQAIGSDPTDVDTDDDGLTDGQEITRNTNPIDGNIPGGLLAIRFNGGANDYVELPLQRRFALPQWTIEAWIRPDAKDAQGTYPAGDIIRRFVGEVEVDGKSFALVNYGMRLTKDGYIEAFYTDAAGIEGAGTDAAKFDDSGQRKGTVKSVRSIVADGKTWTHVAASYDLATHTLTLYVDGARVYYKTASQTPVTYGPGLVWTRVGGNRFKGLIDEVRIWSTAQAETDIQARMLTVLAGTEQDLVAYYRFDDAVTKVDANGLVAVEVKGETAQDSLATSARDWLNDWFNAARLVNGVAFFALDHAGAPTGELVDTDGDRLPDWWELKNGTDPAVDDAAGDPDTDGLTNLYEYLAGTDPQYLDTDQDGKLDRDEDPDADGLINIEEQTFGTDPTSADTDDDGISDPTELFTDWTDPTVSLDPIVPRVLRLTGADSVTVTDSPDTSQPIFTLALWVKPADTATQSQGIVRRMDERGEDANYRLVLKAGNFVEFSYDLDLSGRTVLIDSGRALPANEWSLIIARLDGTAGQAVMDLVLYIKEGREYKRYATTQGGAAVTTPATDGKGKLQIGFTEDSGATLKQVSVPVGFVGDIDEVALWGRLLTLAEQEALVTDAAVPDDATLAAYYKFDDGGDTAEDLTVAADWQFDWRHAGRFSPNSTIVVEGVITGIDEPDVLPDWWEIRFLGSLNASTGADGDDFDGDGLNDLYEYLAGTDPTRADTNGDGVTDLNEDADGDGITNGDEQNVYNTHPNNVDTDDDGLRDNEEADRRNNPVNSLDPERHLAGVPTVRDDTGVVHQGRFVVADQARHKLPQWTIEARVYIPEPVADVNGIILRRVVQNANPDVVNFELGLAAGKPYVRFVDTEGTEHRVDAANALAPKTWTAVTGSFAPDAHTMTLYVDGAPVATDDTIVGKQCQTQGTATDQEISFGAGYADGAGGFEDALPEKTKIDEVRIWNTVRTASEVAADALADTYFIGDETGLVGYWRFDDGLGVESHSIEDFTASTINFGNLPDWFTNWAHAAYPEGAAIVVDEIEPDDDDADGLPNWWETAAGLDPVDNTGNDGPEGDPDEDGLTNLQEYLGLDGIGQTVGGTGDPALGLGDGTNPNMHDTDGDSLPDGTEVTVYHTKPYVQDTDDDSYSDFQELENGWDPLNPLDPFKLRSVRFGGAPGICSGSRKARDIVSNSLPLNSGSVEAPWTRPACCSPSGPAPRTP